MGSSGATEQRENIKTPYAIFFNPFRDGDASVALHIQNFINKKFSFKNQD